MPLMVLAIILLIGCAKEDVADISQTNEDQPIYRAVLTDEGFKNLEALSYEEFTSTKGNTTELRSNPNALANGNFTWDGYEVAGHAIQNKSGAHGAVEQTSLVTGNSWNGDAYCVTTWGEDDNRAVVAWEMTENNNFFPFPEGWFVYTAVEDNGEGANAPSDKVCEIYYFTPPGAQEVYGGCDGMANNGFFPNEFFADVDEGGHIQVQ